MRLLSKPVAYILRHFFEAYMTTTHPLPGLCITDDRAAALSAMFSKQFDIVLLRHPDPVAFEAAMETICTQRPELVSRNYTIKTDQTALRSDMITTIVGSDVELVDTHAYSSVKAWLAALKEIAQKANPTLPDTHCSTRNTYDASYSPLFGYHRDNSLEELGKADAPISWRSVITLVGAGTKIIEEVKLKAACSKDNPMFARALQIVDAEIPIPQPPLLSAHHFRSPKDFRVAQHAANDAWKAEPHNIALIQRARLMRAVRREEILLADVPKVMARPGDMVFILQSNPRYLWHGSPQYTGKPRLGLVLDHFQSIHL